jgi:hypothetical protein
MKDGDQLDESVKNEKEYTKYNKTKEVQLDWLHLAYELPSKSLY